MPFEFEDVSKKVADGSASVKDSLNDLVVAAGKADKAHVQLSDTQKASVAISNKYSKAIDQQTSSSLRLAKASVATVRAMSNISGVSRTIAGSLSGVAGEADNLSTSLSKIEAPVNVVSGMREMAVATEEATKSGAQNVKMLEEGVSVSSEYSKAVDKSAKSLDKSAKASSSAARAQAELGDVSETFTADVKDQMGAVELLASQFKDGRQQAEGFAGGIGVTSGVMVGAGVAAFYLSQKVVALIDSFTDAAVGLSKFNIEAAQSAKMTLGIDASGLASIRDELSLTRDQATQFYAVLREGSASGVKSVDELTAAAVSLQQAFGGDPTEKLREYVSLLETIPTLDTDLSITANLDEQTASLFALAKAGKIQAVIDLQAAGLLGGTGISVASPDDVKMLNEAQRAAKAQEGIQDFLVSTMFPSWGPQFSVIAGAATKGLAGIAAVVFGIGAASVLLKRGASKQVAATNRVTAAIYQTAAGQAVGAAAGSAGGVVGATVGATVGAGFTAGISRIVGQFKLGQFQGGGGAAGVSRGISAVKQGGGVKFLLKETFGPLKNSVSTYVKGTMTAAKAAKTYASTLWSGVSTMTKALNITAWVGLAFTIAGKAAESMAAKMEAEGKVLGASFNKINGAVLTATGTIASFAATGAILASWGGPVGVAAGAIIGALVGVAASIPNTFEKLGSGMVTFGKTMDANEVIVNDSGKSFQKYNKGAEGFGSSIINSGILLEAWGKEMKRTVMEGGKYIAGINDIKKSWTAIGRGMSDWTKRVAQGIIYSDAQVAALQDARDGTRELTSSMKVAATVQTGYAAAQQEAGDRLNNSMLAFEKAVKANEAALNSAKFQLMDMRNELARADLGMLSEFGGSAQEFSDAIGDASKATSSKFGILSKALSQRRIDIIKDGKMNAQQRRVALDELNKAEIEATQDFVKGIGELINGMLKTPGIVASGLKAQISKQRVDFKPESMGLDEFSNEINKELDGVVSSLSGVMGQFKKIEDASKERREGLSKAADEARTNFAEAFKTLPDEVKTKITASLNIDEADIGNLSMDQVSESLRILRDQGDEVGDAIEELDKSLPAGEFKGFIKALKQNNIDAKRAAREVKEAEKKANKMVGKSKYDKSEVDAAENKKLEAIKNQDKVVAQRLEIEKQLNTSYIGSNLNTKESAILMAAMSGNASDMKEASLNNEEALKKVNAIIQKAPGLEKEYKKSLEDRAAKMVEQNQILQAEATISGLATQAQDVVNQELQETLNAESTLFDAFTQIAEITKKVSEQSDKELDAAERRLGVLESASAFETSIGNSLENLSDIAEANLTIYDKTVKSIEERKKILARVKGLLESVANQRESIEAAYVKTLISQGKTQKEAAEKAAEMYVAMKTGLEGNARELEVGLDTLRSKVDKAADKLVDEVNSIERQVTKAFEGFKGRGITAELDLSDARFEFAEFSQDFVKISQEATNAAIKAAGKRAELEAEAIEKGAQTMLNALEAQAKEVERSLIEDDKVDPKTARKQGEAFKREGLKTIETEKQVALEKSKTKQVQSQSESIAKSADIRKREVESAQEALDAESDFLSEIGGDFGRIFDLQKQSLGLEQQKYNIAKEAFELEVATNGESLKTLEMENQLKVQGFALQKKALGAQKSVFERLAGMAFGQIRSSTGVARFRTSAASLLGREGSRVKTNSGLFTGAAGGPTTIRGRSAELQGARRGTGSSGRGRSSLGAGRGGFGAGGSALGAGGSSLGTGKRGLGTGNSTLGTGRRGLGTGTSGAEEARVAAKNRAATDAVERTTAAKPGFSVSSRNSVTSGSKSEAGSGAVAFKFKGEIMVKFDNAMFKSQVAQIVAETVNDAEVRQALIKAGYLNTKA